MLLQIPDVLTADQVAQFRARLDVAPWCDGRVTAGHQSSKAKDNAQLPEDSAEARELGAQVLDALARNSTFFAAALPKRIYPPLFNRYAGGQSFGFHVDNAVRYDRSRGGVDPVRTDLSATLFLSAPDDYDGGELVIEDTYGTQQVKLPAGHMILYPSSSVHRGPNCRPAPWGCPPAPAGTGSRRARAARGWPRSSGSRACCARMPSAG